MSFAAGRKSARGVESIITRPCSPEAIRPDSRSCRFGAVVCRSWTMILSDPGPDGVLGAPEPCWRFAAR
jgi:hypothetical protein